MARGPTARVVLNRSHVDAVRLAVADAAAEVGRSIIEEARPPDAEPFGEGLVTRGGYLAYVGDKKITGGGIDGKQPKKPRAFRVRGHDEIQVIAGFGFPGRFQELGTIHHPAQPFFTPAVDAVLPRVPSIMNGAMRRHLKAIP